MPDREIHVGDCVIFHDEKGVAKNALVTAVWTQDCINLVLVSDDKSKSDTYGRQIERETSIEHKDKLGVHGYYWRFKDEEPNPYKEPLEI